MALKIFEIYLSELSKNESLRLWLPFALPKSKYGYDKFINYLSLIEAGKRPKGGIKDEDVGEAISLGGEQIGADGNVLLSKIPYVSFEYYKKVNKGKVINNDILICKDGALTGKSCFVDFSIFPTKKVMVNEHVYIIRGNEKINQKFLFYYTRTNLFQNQVKDLAYKKKAQPGLNMDHLKKIKIPKIPKSIQDKAVAKIEPIEQKIKQLKSKIKQPQEIINKVFAREFGFDKNLYNEFGKGMTAGTQIAQNRKLRVFETEFQDFSRSSIIRFSTRFHNPPTRKLMDFMKNIKTLKVKDIMNTYEKGVQPKYNSDGEIPVVKIANLKNGYIDFNETENITKEQFDNLDDRKKLKKDDIIMCATGKISLGKIDIFEEEKKTVTAVDNYILRIKKKKYIPLFFTYFFRSVLGYFQIERDYTGATNQIHLYWNQISEFLIPDIPLSKQKKIVKEIKAELDKQKKIEKEIERERNKIDKIIEKAIG